jgi:uncharacterized protein (DUF3820 family)
MSTSNEEEKEKEKEKKLLGNKKKEEENDLEITKDEIILKLDKFKRLSLRKYKGKLLIDIREFYLDKFSGELKPGKKGIALNLENWNKIKNHISDIDEGIENMK